MISKQLLHEKIDQGRLTTAGPHVIHFHNLLPGLREGKPESIASMEYFYRSFGEDKYSINGTCQKCGKNVRYKLEGDVLLPEKDNSCFEDRVIQFVLSVPTGKLIIEDSLFKMRDLISEENDIANGFSLESIYGRYIRTLAYLQGGFLHVFVGNSCPSIIQREDEYYIANTYYPEDDEGNEIDDELFGDNKVPDKIEGSVTTDLWWVSAIDSLFYEQLFIEKYGVDKGTSLYHEALTRAHVILEIPPGDYLVTHDLTAFDEYQKENGSHIPPIYASFKKI